MVLKTDLILLFSFQSTKYERLRRKIRIAQGARPSRDGAYKGMCVPQDASDSEVIGEFNKQEIR